MKIEPLVSIVIPTRNAARALRNCLEAIKNQIYKKIEIIIVDQYSTDGTLEIIKNYNVKLFQIPHHGVYAGPTKSRNFGANKSKGKYIFSVDSDWELQPTIVQECVEKCEKDGYGAVVVHEKDIAKNFWAKCRAFEKEMFINDPYMESARFFRKDIFNKISGYDENLNSGEDWDIHYRLKQVTKVGDIKTRVLHNTWNVKFFKNMKKKFYYGTTYVKYRKKHPEWSKNQLTAFRYAYKKHWKKFVMHPFMTLAFIFYKMSEFTSAWVGIKYSKIKKLFQ